MSLLYVLRGKQVREVDNANGYLTVYFDDGDSGLHIYNAYSTSVEGICELKGKVVQDLSITDDHWRMVFQDGAYLQIGMRECDYNGPESSIYFAGGNFYVDQ